MSRPLAASQKSSPLTLLVLALAACGPQTVRPDEAREVSRPEVVFGLPEARRLGIREPSSAPPPERALEADLPAGWEQVAAVGDRRIDFRVDGAEFTVSRLGGGLAANLNRWRGQLGQAPLTAEEVAALPTIEVLGVPAPRMFVAGESYRPVRGEPVPDAALIGSVADLGSESVFVKFVGPRAVVEREAERFDEAARSLRFVPAPAGAGASPHGPVAPPSTAPGSAPASGGGLSWTLPEGWTSEPAGGMRALTFHPFGDTSLDGSVFVLGGDGGGLVANLNRWRGQIGAQPFDDAAAQALPTIEVLGVQSPWMDVTGELAAGRMTSAPAVADARMLGLVCPLGERTVFVKLTGPNARVAAAREGFLSFCSSLTLAR
jgi:hypothetical protein